ncbi:AAA family ATPase [Candidatus Poribacteria bacterium]|nr:AAA family ATPase [Candidatus Poribacteria bacterium]
MKFPYGIANFHQVITEGYFYQDRTGFIRLLEEEGKNLLFLRPRRFGKSLLLSMLAHYYDVKQAENFEKLFGHLAIGNNPTPRRNSYFVLKWDFSFIEVSGELEDIKKSLYTHINHQIEEFYSYYEEFLPRKGKIDESAIFSLTSLISAVRETPYRIYLLIDEYDNFANEVLMSRRDKETYQSLVEKEGVLKTVFKTVKFACTEGGIDRVFITGVSHLVMSDMTIGYNIAKNIYFLDYYHTLCGFTEGEVKEIVSEMIREGKLSEEKLNEAIEMMESYYNGYRFSIRAEEKIYNPTMSLYFFDYLYRECRYPEPMLDSNLAMDAEKIRFISDVGRRGEGLLLDIVQGNRICVNSLKDRFSILDILYIGERDISSRVSYLYYFGVLTLAEKTVLEYCFEVPNHVIRGLYIERIRGFISDGIVQDEGIEQAKEFLLGGDIKPLIQFVEQKILPVFKNREYRWMNEFSLKMMFLCFLFWENVFVIDSEPELGRGYADLLLMVRPDKQGAGLHDILIEFKYVGLNQIKLKGEEVRGRSDEELIERAEIREVLKGAKEQLNKYAEALVTKHPEVNLRKYTVVGVGMERIVGVEVKDN